MPRSVLSPEIVQSLLEKLSSDDAFRSAFAVDPAKALIALGADADCVDGCQTPLASLGDKEEFAQAAALMTERLAATGPFKVPFMFESGLKGLQD
ncbi:MULTISPECIES: NHLP-related RiPP peptide [unclassified Stenotrophomonas]|uniref:NHLP-related RiPP peptide n=1 Tax=unclassified Stenotrophomonas TaxID=196198 RepID=UPI00190D3DC9|nr:MULTISPECIES: NHLP-related RiPP peptide [unclassified Stenotrophomonas]MBK0056031.1 putative modified peptide [Stenotrophomonas sp. S39]MDI9272770.1 NHLP-related RiPP peptide [Stenotrophomonas sp. PFBMAA-4]